MTPETARPFIDIHPPVAEALAANRPVVALESTIITHGMPYPDNGAMAADVEKIILDEGAVPATIAVVNGRIKIGLSDGERESLAMTGDAMKLSRADLAFAVAEGRTGGTTVAATMISAALVEFRLRHGRKPHYDWVMGMVLFLLLFVAVAGHWNMFSDFGARKMPH